MGLPSDIRPPFSEASAWAKVQAAEDAWNSMDVDRVVGAYSLDTVWRNRDEFFNGREEVRGFLEEKWAKENGYRLRKWLWSFTEDRISVKFEYEWHDEGGQWYRSYGNEQWEFNADGLMGVREASINDVLIEEGERRIV